MPDHHNAWTPILAEREGSGTAVAASFPCRGPYNRYLGCVGARRCRASGVAMCVLGRWPDEHAAAGRARRASDDSASLSARSIAKPPAKTQHAQAAEVPTAATAVPGDRLTIMVVQPDRRIWQHLSRQAASAGYEAAWFADTKAAVDALHADQQIAAVLVDSSCAASAGASDELFELCADRETPVLRLPSGQRDAAGAEAMARMTMLWLTVTFSGQQDATSPCQSSA